MKSTNYIGKNSVICFGEVLWDIFPAGSKPGGAPMNVAYHLRKFDINSSMISRVGNDELGDKLLKLLQGWNIPTENCQLDSIHETGKVEANVGTDNEVSYTIHQPAAWDFISWQDSFEPLVKSADALVFGSLATRNDVSRDTLYRLLESAPYKVFDVNLRPPFFSIDILKYLLGKCNLLKLNQSELDLILQWFPTACTQEEDCVRFLQDKFQINEVIVTKGSKGASYYTPFCSYSSSTAPVKVKDTVGSGDSFLAAFLAKKIQKATPDTMLSFATALGAYVATQEGACPSYSLAELESFRKLNSQLQFS
ncbi:MAG: carbohydrate kinase [Bacteroidota bacterium]|nr:carbohydrate kinase [Bacteroidota bacterium]